MHNASSTRAAPANSGSINWHAPLSKTGWATVTKVQVTKRHATMTSAAPLNHWMGATERNNVTAEEPSGESWRRKMGVILPVGQLAAPGRRENRAEM